MAIYDCFQYFNEDHIADLRFNILNEFVDKFVIVESIFNHKGEKRKPQFDISKYSKFKDKIINLEEKLTDFHSKIAIKSIKKILEDNNIDCEVVVSNVDEDEVKNSLLAEGANPSIISKNLAEIKSIKVSSKNPDKLVIGADSVVSLNNKLINKPKSREEALEILKKLNNSRHYLISSVCISKNGAMIWNHTDQSELKMKNFSDKELIEYLDKIQNELGCQIIVLSNLPHHNREKREVSFKNKGLNFPIISNSGLKGMAIKEIAKKQENKIFFIDDISANLLSTYNEVDGVKLIHYISDKRLEKLAITPKEVDFKAKNWKEIYNYIENEISR